ncbi:MAG: gliding motility-associated C-terminal domain-containing protein, partial [Bacteroidota bacterium]|nr:gliding motility-associated C-terminal domain-containing protein [Bacteroidota bacterium]MDX5430418.1 gliding motility-associated C-terminal domain-containing protein [Bacteroidota bacterium]MDX5469177.1 gliding motility-associated C-terminal domain-containing protein [Bacteroidota bacterium]
VCLGDTTRIELHACVDLDSVIWELPGQAPQKQGGQVSFMEIVITQAGDYPVKITSYYHGQALVIEKFLEIKPRIPPFSLGPDLNICGNQAQITSPVSASYYEWSTYDTSATLNIPGPGKYWLTLGHYGCLTQSDTIEIKFFNQPKVMVPMENKICPEDTLEFNAYAGNYLNANCQYSWSNGDTGITSNYQDSGWHHVIIANTVCADTGYFHITQLPRPNSFTTDTLVFCSSGDALIQSPDRFMHWNNMSDTVFLVPLDTLFIAEISNGYCSRWDSLRLLDGSIHKPFDTLHHALCLGDSLLLNLDSLNDYQFQWDDGSTHSSATLIADSTKLIRLDLSRWSCQETVWIALGISPIIPTLFPDTPYVLCPESDLRIAIPAPYTIRWSNQTYLDSLTFNLAGHYPIQIESAEGCKDTQVLSIQAISALPILDSLGCVEKEFILDAPVDFAYCHPAETFQENGKLHFVSAGTYEVFVEHQNCILPVLNLELFSDCDIYIPTGFSPNDDGLNDVFQPATAGQYAELRIYNRWGECVFDYTGYEPRWDGRFQDKACPDGFYAYVLYLPNSPASKKSHNGTISILR